MDSYFCPVCDNVTGWLETPRHVHEEDHAEDNLLGVRCGQCSQGHHSLRWETHPLGRRSERTPNDH